ncbi:MAG: NAD(P)/FAD-dependent oxidoreductase [Clostridiales bacterium]|nr:NAD(P)/FAD-dependent oxidoreductase [Clostridiales bacterium]
MKIAIIGGGASGLMAGGICASKGCQVDIFEKNEKVGKKLYITGKGRCNVTNCCDNVELLQNVVNNNKFLYSAFNQFNSYDTINFFVDLGVSIKVERGNRAFPNSDKSSDIIKALERFNLSNGVKIHLNHSVMQIKKDNNKFRITTNCGVYDNYDATILCVGGKTYSATGSTGDGYEIAKSFGHNITKIVPGLVPLLLADNYVKSIEGLSLKNVTLSAYQNGKLFKSLFGEMLFTANGISGPIALSMSSYINKLENVNLKLDFKPALTNEQLLARIEREIDDNRQIQISTLLASLLPKAMIDPFLQKLAFDKTTKVKSLNVKDIKKIVLLLKSFDLKYKGLDKLDYGIITSGGVDTKEINPKTMESKLVKGLFFAGEIIDVDALTGGFNLQIAFSTGYLAGINASLIFIE